MRDGLAPAPPCASASCVSPPVGLALPPLRDPPAPYPLDALGPGLAAAARAIAAATQAPAAMAAQAVLAAVSLAVQRHWSVRLPSGEIRPASCYVLTVAESGERRGSVAGLAFAPVRAREADLARAMPWEERAYHDRMRAWCLARARAARAALRAPPADGGPPEIVPHEAAGLERWARADAALLLQDKPRPPAPPFLLCEPAAAGDLADQLKARPGLLLCAEGAAVLRGAAAPAAGALLRDLWDAGAFVHGRGRKAERLWGRRLTLHAVLSPDDAHALLRDPRAAREGLFARFLVAAPASRIGLRAWREPADDPALAAFGRRIGALIDPAAGPPADVGEVQTRTVGFAPAARARWIAFAGEMENRAAPGGDYAHLRPLASRLPQHAARLAALLAGFADIDAADIGEGWAEAGIALARYYGAEARRLADTAGPDGAAEVLAWLRRTRADRPFALADVCRAGPPRVRRVAAARAVVTALEARGHVRPVRDARLPPPAWELVA